MSEKINDGGQAFPLKEPLTSDCLGMSLRDYFAAKAMQSYLSDFECSWDVDGLQVVADAAYRAADAMLKARKS